MATQIALYPHTPGPQMFLGEQRISGMQEGQGRGYPGFESTSLKRNRVSSSSSWSSQTRDKTVTLDQSGESDRSNCEGTKRTERRN